MSSRDVAVGQGKDVNPLGVIYRAAGFPHRFKRVALSRSTVQFFPSLRDVFICP